jgi:transcription-repair coupling factor (superfamily II helicase)
MPTAIAQIESRIKPHNALYLNDISWGVRGYIISLLARKDHLRTTLAILPTEDDAKSCLNDILFFCSASERKRTVLYPEVPSSPFSHISPDPDIFADRLAIQKRLIDGEPLVVIASAAALIRRIVPRRFIRDATLAVSKGKEVATDELISYLIRYGYEDAALVEDEASFAKRGGLIDIWPPAYEQPVRLEFDGDRIASMRHFDPQSQRSKKAMGELPSITLIPARDIPMDIESRNRAAHLVRERSDTPLTAAERRSLIESIHEGVMFSGIETLAPIFHDTMETIFDYLPDDTVAFAFDPIDIEAMLAAAATSAAELYSEGKSAERIVRPEEILIGAQEFMGRLSKMTRVVAGGVKDNTSEAVDIQFQNNRDIRPLIESHREGEDMLAPLVQMIKGMQSDGWQIVLTCHTEIQAERLGDLFHLHGIDLMPFDSPFETLSDLSSTVVKLRIGRLSSGFRLMDEKLAIITDEEIFGGKISMRPPHKRAIEPFASLAEIADGDPIVHELHGIGRYRGLAHLTIDKAPGDYLLIEYLGGDKLYLPVYRMNLVGRYIGSKDAPPPLDKLGGIKWQTMQAKVRQEIGTIAKDLLKLFAERRVHPGFAFPDGGTPYEEFCAAFPYDETPDQEQAIEDVIKDMSDDKPSDRLICGDVGYGKTEVAMRAAYVAAMAGKQVAVLVPTTVLALQHYETFTKRFAGTPISIDMLSRFRIRKDRKAAVENIKRGATDIVIGTHRLLQRDISFKDLGLLIVDEEHRFGVRHKEKIKRLKATVDVISMTATPIPRTLNLALTGIRDISVINTAPLDRQSVATFVVPFDEGIIRQALLKEISRGGQVFFVHNRVETIDSFAASLRKLVPEARIAVGHGQQGEGDLEDVMIDFLEHRSDVLLCTTIIESGLDIPNANTIIIHRADTFGLAQLYQLRGRVGRSDRKAYAYLLTPPDREMTLLARKRLAVLSRFTELGSGFQIAMHDMEFRGTGNILGSAQSGHINAIGYELYVKLLDRTIRKLKGEKVEEEIDPELNLGTAAFLPESYVPSQATRIDLYKRLSGLGEAQEIDAMEAELTDRFGDLPPEARRLLRMMEIKILAKEIKARQLTFENGLLSIRLHESTPLPTELLISLAAKEPSRFRIVPPDKFVVSVGAAEDEDAGLCAIKNCLSSLLSYVSPSQL